jgi:predicted DNA-binding protein (MmcQ/YjbR family)
MNIEQYRNYCISKKGVTEEFPFDEDTLAFKVMGKMFALTSLKRWEEGDHSVNLKCDPDWAVELRAQFEAVIPGFHMNKKHWNTVAFNQDVPDKMILELIDHSYDLVVSSLTKKLQAELANL